MIRALAFITAALACLSDLRASGVDEASIIVMGTITAGMVSDREATASLRVDKVLKGEAVVGQILSVEGAVARTGKPFNLAGQSGLWFLKPTSQTSQWKLLWPVAIQSPMSFEWFCLSVSSIAELELNYVFQSGYSAPDNIAAAIAFTLKKTSAPYGTLGEGSPWRLLTTIFSLPKSPVVISKLEGLVDSPNLEIQIAALAGLLRANRVDYLPSLLALPESLPKSLMAAELFSALGSICDNDPTTVSRLGSILAATHIDSGLRLGAARALARVHSATTLLSLDSALANPNPNFQKLGVEGFSLFVENMPVKTPESAVTMSWLHRPASALFKNAVTDKYVRIYPPKDDELPELVGFWRQWYRSNQSAIEQHQ